MATEKSSYSRNDINKIPALIDIVKTVANNYLQMNENFDVNSNYSQIILTLSERERK